MINIIKCPVSKSIDEGAKTKSLNEIAKLGFDVDRLLKDSSEKVDLRVFSGTSNFELKAKKFKSGNINAAFKNICTFHKLPVIFTAR